MNTTPAPASSNKKPNTESFRDAIATVDKQGKRKWLYPTKPSGRLYNYRKYLSYFYLALFFGLPFLKYEGEPFFLFNILERKFILFGMIFWPQDFFIFGVGMLIFIVFIALFTVIYGRVFCGWVCPQTIFMEMVFRRVEYWIEGDATHQRALKKAPWNSDKIIRRAGKQTAFYLISFLIANTFLAYIIGVDNVFGYLRNFRSEIGTFVAVLGFTTVFYFVYAWFREQVCIIVCPYGRMQGVLLDQKSVVVAYDFVRGEPRGKFRKNQKEDDGDCIDCSLCVKVCPTGIDIRNGTQLECINCTACIDACDHMMESVNRPKGLIRFDSEQGIKERSKKKFGGRMLAYSIVLLVLLGIEATLLATRSDYEATVLRAKGLLYQEKPNGEISNLFTIKLVNKTRDSLPVTLKVENAPGIIRIVGRPLAVAREGVSQGTFFVYLPKKSLTNRKTKLKIGVYSNNRLVKTVNTNFLGPVGGHLSPRDPEPAD